MKEYLVEVTKVARRWIKAVDEESAEEIAESMEDNDYEEVEDVRVIDSRELDADDEDSYREYLEEDEEEEEW
jgi:phosphoribosylformylglycinamidine (FGAM) synthase PurS component